MEHFLGARRVWGLVAADDRLRVLAVVLAVTLLTRGHVALLWPGFLQMEHLGTVDIVFERD